MAKYDVVRIENRAGGYSEHLGEINAPTLESAQDRASVEYECPESCRLVVSECESEETPAKHTPGPWGVSGMGGDVWIKAGPIHVATIPRAFDGDWSPANAALIAAAPELLNALWALLGTAMVIQSTNESLRQSGIHACGFAASLLTDAEAAIAKARGV